MKRHKGNLHLETFTSSIEALPQYGARIQEA